MHLRTPAVVLTKTAGNGQILPRQVTGGNELAPRSPRCRLRTNPANPSSSSATRAEVCIVPFF